MIDLITRSILHPIDYLGVLKNTTLTLSDYRIEEDGIHSLIFTSPKPLHWRAGQHGLFSLVTDTSNKKEYRAFSIASAPHEKVIRIGTKIPTEPSDFKKQLLALKAHDTIRVCGPFGEFHTKPNMKQIIGIAGGIGITPFRSIIADMNFKKDSTPTTLIYSTSWRHTYKSEFDEWKKLNPNLTIIYANTTEQVRSELEKLIEVHKNKAHYFISGSPMMITAISDTCKKNGINSKNIINDPFKGY